HNLLMTGHPQALIAAHVIILWYQNHTKYPGPRRTEKQVICTPMFPGFALKAGGFFFFTFAAITGLSAFVQINPIHLFGPFTPTSITSGLQPYWYLGFMEGSIRRFPLWVERAS